MRIESKTDVRQIISDAYTCLSLNCYTLDQLELIDVGTDRLIYEMRLKGWRWGDEMPEIDGEYTDYIEQFEK